MIRPICLALVLKFMRDKLETSVLYILERNPFVCGSMSNTKSITPIPPIQWVAERQKRMPFGRDSISVSMVAPVVVYPDTLSKKALAKVNSPPHIT